MNVFSNISFTVVQVVFIHIKSVMSEGLAYVGVAQ